MTTLTNYMKKQQISKKSEKNEELSLNHGKALRFRKRIQEDKEHLEILKEFIDGDYSGVLPEEQREDFKRD